MKTNTKELILISLFAALMVVGAKLIIPTPFGVPLTFQLFFAVYAGLLLKPKSAVISQLIYLLIGLIGIPVFAYGGGLQYLLNPTFGYLVGFMLTAGTISFMLSKSKTSSFMVLLGITLIGYSITYVVGNVYFYLIKNLYLAAPIGLLNVFTLMIPYMIKDLVLIVLAAYTATLMLPILRKTGYVK
jgi:biotin transport system substrate-specific component